MSSPLERRYRRVLRLLPAGYRHRWEEDMVSAFMEGAQSGSPADATSGRPPLAERLSVAALAVRLRLAGSHATPRSLVWYHAVHRLALIVLLYQAMAATIQTGYTFRVMVESTVGLELPGAYPRPSSLEFFVWSRVFSLLWVAVFLCFILGRPVAARVLAVLALVATVAVTIAIYVVHGIPASQGVSFGLAEVSRWGWLAVSVSVVFLSPPGIHVSRRFWLCTYLAGALILICFNQLDPLRSWSWTRFINLTNATSAALILAMAIALVHARPGRHRSPWLLALASFAGAVGSVQLMTSLVRPEPPIGLMAHAGVTTILNLVSVGLAVICAVAGLLALRRLPSSAVPA